MLFRFAICGSVPEIFAIKVESCQKSRRILDVFSPSKILGGRPSKSYRHFITHAMMPRKTSLGKSFVRILPLAPKLYGLTRWILSQILNFHDKIFWGTPISVRCALSWLGQYVTRVKIWGGSTPQGPKCSLPRNVRLSGSIWATKTFLFVDESSPFFHPTWKGL